MKSFHSLSHIHSKLYEDLVNIPFWSHHDTGTDPEADDTEHRPRPRPPLPLRPGRNPAGAPPACAGIVRAAPPTSPRAALRKGSVSGGRAETLYLHLAQHLPSASAARCSGSVPSRSASSASAATSSLARKNGYRAVSALASTTPAAHTSTAVVWCGYFSNTSGGRKPCVPARGARGGARLAHAPHTPPAPAHAQRAAPACAAPDPPGPLGPPGPPGPPGGSAASDGAATGAPVLRSRASRFAADASS